MRFFYVIAAVMIVASSCCRSGEEITVIPYPNQAELHCGHYDVAGADFYCSDSLDSASRNVVEAFAARLSLVTGKESLVKTGTSRDGFIFIHDAQMPHEAYTLHVSRKAVEIKASGLNGFNYALQTVRQMLPKEIFGTEQADLRWTLPCCTIDDAPRFGYRGMHLDVSRHFFTVEQVKRYLDIMELHKLNTLHWHLTDDQGWRIEIKKYPRLTEVGSVRNKTVIGHIYNNNGYDTTPYGEGMWYSQEQIREVVEYAAAKGITVIPEIDLPGHMLAALAAYPELGCTGGPYQVWGDWGVADDVLCAGKEKTMLFLEDVLAEVCELFPAEYVHIGGDECPKVRWEKCPRCQAKIRELGLKDDENYKAEHYLQGYVMTRMEKFLSSKGKRVIGWDEILEGELGPEATVMSWRGVAGGLQAVRMGHDAIMTPNTFYYLDYYQTTDKDNEPLAIGGYLPVEKCYSYEPFTEDMTDEEKGHILGVQANLWTEYIATEDHLQYMLLPRMAALSEVQWCQPENKNWNRFYDSADDICAIYDMLGYEYGKHIFQTKMSVSVNPEKNKVEVSLVAQGGAPIYYTQDGSIPDKNSTLYTGPIEVNEICTINATTVRENMNNTMLSKTFKAHKAMGRPVSVAHTPHKSYTFSCPQLLVDGVRGADNYNNGDYAGWYRKDLDAVIDMGGEAYSSVTLGVMVFKYDYIFNPLDLVIYTSEDGKEYTEVARLDIPVEKGEAVGNGPQEYTATFPETSAKYLKVTARTIEALPEWHGSAGRPGFLFVDEIVVH